MYLHCHLFLLFLSLFLLTSASEVDYDGWLQIRLWHAINPKSPSEFTDRGNITVSSIRSGSSIVTQSALSTTDVSKFLALAANNNNKYLLKAAIKTSSGSENTFLASVLACNLIGSDLQDSIHVWLDSVGEPVAVNILSRGPCIQDSKSFTNNKFMTEVYIRFPDGGPAPDTFSYIQKLERERLARESGEVKDNRSFFAKYWMYIIPAVIFFVLSSATNPEAAGGGGNGGGPAAIQRQ